MSIELSEVTVPPVSQTHDLARIFRALGDPSRLAIFQLVREYTGDEAGRTAHDLRGSVTEIANQFDLSLSTVSHHLKELRTAGLISCERRGQHIYCSVDPEALSIVDRFLKGAQA
jgi:ArsR family transcriptional regulator